MPLSATDTAHLVRRAGFGVTGPLFAELRGIGSRAGAVDRLLDQSRAENDDFQWPALGSFLTAEVDFAMLQRLWLDRMARTEAPLIDKLTLFWHGHFATSAGKVDDLNLLSAQIRMLRHGALGSFADLLEAVSVDPAMLVYLDNWTNTAGTPQENFGREVLEKFTVGPGGRTEADVVGMTRAWTGYGLNDVFGENHGTVAQFHPDRHDNGRKLLFGLSRNWSGPAAVAELVLRSRREQTARNIAARLFSFFAYPITADSQTAINLARVFSRSNLSIRALVRAILLSNEFWSPAARGALVRSPIEFVVASLQATGQSALVVNPDGYLPQMGQVPYAPPSIAGWGQNEYWLSTASTWGKAAYAIRLREVAGSFGVLGQTKGMAPRDAATQAFSTFGIVTPAASTRKVVEAMVARLQKEHQADLVPRSLIHLMLLSPDFQLA